MPTFHDGTLKVAKFQFSVLGSKQSGVIYVRTRIRSHDSSDSLVSRAKRMARDRSGDPYPEMIRHNLNGDIF